MHELEAHTIMLPSWLTKLRDVNAGSKHSNVKPHGSPLATSKKQEKAPTGVAKFLSLRRASSKARNACFESDILDACRNEDITRPSISSIESELCKGMQNVHDLPAGLHKEATGALLTHQCILLDVNDFRVSSQAEVDIKNMEVWDDDVQSMSDCMGDVMSNSSSGKESLASKQKGHVVSDIDTEEFSVTSETSSSFGSDMSSADSSVSSKRSTCEQEGHQESRIWQEGFKTYGSTCRNLQKDCDGCVEVDPTKEHEGSVGIDPMLMARLNQESAEIRESLVYGLQTGRQCSFYSSSMGSGCNSVSSKGGRDGSPNSDEIRERCKSSNLMKRNTNDSSFISELDDECGLLGKAATKQQVADRKMAFKFSGGRDLKAIADMKLDFSNGKHMTCALDGSSLAMAQGSSQEEREAGQSTVRSPEMTTSSSRCAHRMNMGEICSGKCRTVQMQRRRQRGSSISAVLPPDLQGAVGDSLAFVKISNEPYEDFRQSMYEMIMEKDLEGSMDVEELLYCYLTLNSPEHHELIEEVFSDVWSAILMTMR